MKTLNEISFVGNLHNHCLQNMTMLQGFPNITMEQAFAVAKQTIRRYYLDTNLGPSNLMEYSLVSDWIDRILQAGDDQKQNLVSLRSERLISEELERILTEIVDYLEGADDPVLSADRLFQFSSEISKSVTLLGQEKTVAFGAVNVGISSIAFWYGNFQNPNTPWPEPTTSNLPKWIAKALRDLLGFVVGAATSGLINGGNAPQMDAAAGVLVGGAASSGD
jgi:hypothetical protein